MRKVNLNRLTGPYMYGMIVLGTAALAAAILSLPTERLDLYFIALFVLTVSMASRMSVRLPGLRSHIAFSDAFIFLALVMYGGEAAVIMAAAEAFFASWRFCRRGLTIAFNTAVMAFSTAAVAGTLHIAGLTANVPLHSGDSTWQQFVIALTVIGLVQFLVNTGLAAVHESLKDSLELFATWKDKYLWSFVTYFVGAVCAGVLSVLTNTVGLGVLIAAFPVAYLVYLTCRVYISNIEISQKQAEQARDHARTL